MERTHFALVRQKAPLARPSIHSVQPGAGEEGADVVTDDGEAADARLVGAPRHVRGEADVIHTDERGDGRIGGEGLFRVDVGTESGDLAFFDGGGDGGGA